MLSYNSPALSSAIKMIHQGVIPSLDCDGSTVDQISWYFNLKYVPTFPRVDFPHVYAGAPSLMVFSK